MSTSSRTTADELDEQLRGAEAIEEKLSILDLFLANVWAVDDPDDAFRRAREYLRLARRAGDRSAIANGLRLVGESLVRLERWERGLRFLGRARRLQEELRENPGRLSRIHYEISRGLHGLGRYQESLEECRASLATARECGDRLRMAAALAKIGDILRLFADYVGALEALAESVAIWEELGNQAGLAGALLNTGIVHNLMLEPDRACALMYRSLECYRAAGNREGEGLALNNLASSYYQLGDLEKGLALTLEALPIFREIGSRQLEAYALRSIAQHYVQAVEPDIARGYIEQALAIYRALDDRSGIMWMTIMAGQMRGLQEMIPEAIVLFEEALVVALAMNNRHVECDLYKMLAQGYEFVNDLPNAVDYLKRFMALYNELLNQQTGRKVMTIEQRAEMERERRELEMQRQNVIRLELEMERRSRDLTALALDLERKGSGGDRLAQGRFFSFLSEQFPALTPAELKICVLLKLNLSSKEIAGQLNLSSHTVDTHRRSIRRKLALAPDDNLVTFLAVIERRMFGG